METMNIIRSKSKPFSYEYYRPDWGEKPEDATGFESSSHDLQFAVEDLCEERYSDWAYAVPDDIRIRRVGEAKWHKAVCEVIEYNPRLNVQILDADEENSAGVE